ncbi:dUTP diphosphatase [Treponema pectinovorum]|uniref:dUTP diphosphatase n=1 Tax=Treponema pectinovorum TaxID=164 RepID=UPI003D90E7DA
MQNCEIKIVAEDGVKLPSYQTSGSAGCDICAYLPEGKSIVLKPMERFLVPTGIKMSIPEGFEVQVRPRSGLAAKNGVTCLNTPGTIDSDYRGEVKIILINLGSEDFEINSGDRIAQLVVAPVTQANFLRVDELDKTARGEGGFGHTGK